MLTALSIPRTRMSPTEFSNYIKQRAMQQQQNGNPHAHGSNGNTGPLIGGLNHLGALGSVSPSRSVSPNPLANAVLAAHSPDPYFFNGAGGGCSGANNISPMSLYPPQFGGGGVVGGGGGRNMYGNMNDNGLFGTAMQQNKSMVSPAVTAATSSNYRDPNGYGFGGLSGGLSGNTLASLGSVGGGGGGSGSGSGNHSNGIAVGLPIAVNNMAVNNIAGSTVTNAANGGGGQQASSSGDSSPSSGSGGSLATDGTKLMDGLSAFYTNAGPYQHLLVAN